MKQFIMVAVIALVVAGCSTTKDQQAVQPETRQSTVMQPQRASSSAPAAQTNSSPSQSGVSNPLRDSRSILSKRNVYFDYDQFVVKEEFRPVVNAHAKYLASQAAARLTVQGNADERGSREYNLALGQKRADAVKQMLVLSGARPQNIETVSFGEEKPRAQGEGETAWAENRRADIVYAGE